jgi:DNA (cytosine-5)-methyltransferase 1
LVAHPVKLSPLYSHKKSSSSDKWKLLYSFGRIINDVEPEIISMENVPQLIKYDSGRVFNDFLNVLKSKDYYFSYKIVNAQNYGVPQRRKRLILFASKYGNISIIPETHNQKNFKTVADAISHLPPIEDGIASDSDPLHLSRKLTPINKLRIHSTPPGGSWRDWDESLILECHKKESGKEFGSVYGRMWWDDVSPTLTTYCTGLGNGRFGHPQQDRAISLREAALLQSFPEYYDFIENNSSFKASIIARQIGNAVPVQLGNIVAKTIKLHLEEYDS